MKVRQHPIVEQPNPSEDLVERVKENQAKLTEEPEIHEDYEDYDSEGNIIIPPRVVDKSVIEEGPVPHTPSKPKIKQKIGRRIVGNSRNPKPREWCIFGNIGKELKASLKK